VNDLSTEIEHLEESISKVKSEIGKYSGQGQAETSDGQRKQILHTLEAKLGKTESKAVMYTDKYDKAMSTVSALKAGIESMWVVQVLL
jgi:hypothetical protein